MKKKGLKNLSGFPLTDIKTFKEEKEMSEMKIVRAKGAGVFFGKVVE